MSTGSSAIFELSIVGVVDAGVPNKERIVLRPTQVMSLAGFGIAAGIFETETGGAQPVFDATFWFPGIVVEPPSWILVYTGKGEATDTTLENGDRVLTLFWQRQHVTFSHPQILPVLFRVGAAVVGRRV